MPHWKEIVVFCMWVTQVFPQETSTQGGPELPKNCYAKAVHDELLKVIDIVKAHTIPNSKPSDRRTTQSHLFKRFQEDEDESVIDAVSGSLPGVNNLVPTIFKLIGSAIALNSTGLTEGSFGLLPESVSTQITSALGSIAGSILGPGFRPKTTPPPTPRTPPPRRRRRTTTTMPPSSAEITNATTSTEPSTTLLSANITSVDNTTMETVLNATDVAADIEVLNVTMEATTELGPTTTEVLFKESSLGELPVYAAAYAPNYVLTTAFPVYASNFLHVLYPAPTTTTVPTTSTSTASTTSTDPNSYAISLPFDYMELTASPGGSTTELNFNLTPNFTYPSYIQNTPPEYQEYEYEENTEEAKSDWGIETNLVIKSSPPSDSIDSAIS